MLPIDLPGIVVTNTDKDDRLFSIHAGCEGKAKACPECGSTALYAHGTHQQDIMDLPHHGRFACIHLARKRWRCTDCGTTFFHPLDWIDDDHRATARFVEHIARLSLDRSFSDLAREYGVHEKTIRNIFYRHYQDAIDTARFESPSYLGIDEIKIAGGLRGVITNIKDRAGIEFLPKNTTAVLSSYFEKMSDRGNVKAVAIDCAQHYRALIHKYFPAAAVVADKYHILRAADFAVDKIRIATREGIESRRTKLKLKKDKYILKTREHALTDWERSQVELWRQHFPLIGVTYDLKEEFYRIYDAKSEDEARLRFHTWRHRIPPELGPFWAPILTTWANWEKEIFAYWDHPITNAYTECQNMLTRAIDRIGRGYSFDALRVKLLLAPKKQGIVTSYRTLRKRKTGERNVSCWTIGGSSGSGDSWNYVDTMVPDRRPVTWGINLEELEDWLGKRESASPR